MKNFVQTLLTAVPEDSESIGNQAQFELLKKQFPSLKGNTILSRERDKSESEPMLKDAV